MKKILILTLRSLHNGPRIIREINALKHEYEIAAVGLTGPEIAGVKFYDITRPRRSFIDRSIRKIYRTIFRGRLPKFDSPILSKYIETLIRLEKPGIIITHEPEFLPQLNRLKLDCKFKLIYNAHEYHPLQYDWDERWLRTTGRYYNWIYEKYLSGVDLMINVCDGIADKCREVFKKDSIVIPNACIFYENVYPVHVEDEVTRIIHHGNAIPARKIEYMIEAVTKLGSQFSLDLILMQKDPKYLKKITEMVENSENVNIIDPVAFNEIVPLLNKYDIGLFNLPPYTFNYQHALPNKLFEFIQARLCVVVSNSSEMKKIVEEHELGVVSKGYSVEELITSLNQLNKAKIAKYKNNAHKAAKLLSAENYYEFYRREVRALFVS